jgi:hypothetical protein
MKSKCLGCGYLTPDESCGGLWSLCHYRPFVRARNAYNVWTLHKPPHLSVSVAMTTVVTANSFDGRRPLAHVQPSSFRLQM